MRHRACLSAFCALLAIAACSPAMPEAPLKPVASEASLQYHIAAGDELDIDVWRDQTLTRTVYVRPDGLISVPLVGDVRAAGKTPSQLSQELENRLAPLVHTPKVVINVKHPVGQLQDRVRVTGEVVTPRAILFRPNLTILDALIAVGGLTKFADGNRTILIRKDGETSRRYRVRLDDLLNKGDISADIVLAPGDVIIVPESFL